MAIVNWCSIICSFIHSLEDGEVLSNQSILLEQQVKLVEL